MIIDPRLTLDFFQLILASVSTVIDRKRRSKAEIHRQNVKKSKHGRK